MAQGKPQSSRRARAAAHHDPERWSRLLIVGGVVAVIVIAMGFIAFGWYQTQIKPARKTVLSVGKTEFSLRHLERRMSLALDESPNIAQTDLVRVLPDLVLGELETEAKLIEAGGELNNVTVTEKDIDTAILTKGNLGAEAEPRQFATELQRQVEDSGLSTEQYRQMVRAELLETKAKGYFAYLAPAREAQARYRWIVLENKADGEQALERLNAGEAFDAVAAEVSLDTNTKDSGGEVDWRPRGATAEDAVDNFLFDAQPGQRSEVIEGEGSVFIVELLERQDDRELGEQQRQQVIDRNFQDWLEGLNEKLDISRNLNDDDRIRALNDVRT